MSADHYYDRIDALAAEAEEALEEIPADADETEIHGGDLVDAYWRYQERVEWIEAIRSELEIGYPDYGDFKIPA